MTAMKYERLLKNFNPRLVKKFESKITLDQNNQDGLSLHVVMQVVVKVMKTSSSTYCQSKKYIK